MGVEAVSAGRWLEMVASMVSSSKFAEVRMHDEHIKTAKPIVYVTPSEALVDKAADVMYEWVMGLEHMEIPNRQKMANLFANESFFRLLALDGEAVAGFIVAFCCAPFYSTSLVAGELGAYVAPQYRGAGIGKHLYAAMEQWGKSMGAKRVWVGQTTGFTGSHELTQAYHRMGYAVRGMSAVKEIYV